MTSSQLQATVRNLDPDSAMPLFHQLAACLRDEIFRGVYRPHQQLPSEPELCRLYRVSRATVRLALDILVEQQLIYRRHGKGTFVRPPEPKIALLSHPSIALEMRVRGIEPTTRPLALGRRRIPAEAAQFMQSPDNCTYYRERLVLGDGKPWAIVRVYLHPSLEITASDLMMDDNILDVLFDRFNVRVIEAFYLYLEPVLIKEREASLLEVAPGTPGLSVARLLMDQGGRAVVFSHLLVRGDRCRLMFSSRGGPLAEEEQFARETARAK